MKLWRNICDFALGILEFSSLRGEAKQSLGILNLFLGILNGILSEITQRGRGMTQGLGNSKRLLRLFSKPRNDGIFDGILNLL